VDPAGEEAQENGRQLSTGTVIALTITLLAIAAISFWADKSNQDDYQASLCVEVSQDGHCDRLSRDAVQRGPAPGPPLDTALDLGASKIAKIVRDNYCPLAENMFAPALNPLPRRPKPTSLGFNRLWQMPGLSNL
jgi:hypothetical protein